jgi:hypothetical protein
MKKEGTEEALPAGMPDAVKAAVPSSLLGSLRGVAAQEDVVFTRPAEAKPLGLQEAALKFIDDHPNAYGVAALQLVAKPETLDKAAEKEAKKESEYAHALMDLNEMIREARSSQNEDRVSKLEALKSSLSSGIDPSVIRKMMANAMSSSNSSAGKAETLQEKALAQYADALDKVDKAFDDLEANGAKISDEDKRKRADLKERAVKGDPEAIKELYRWDSRILDDMEKAHPELKHQIDAARKDVERAKTNGENHIKITEQLKEKPASSTPIHQTVEAAEAVRHAQSVAANFGMSSGNHISNSDSGTLSPQMLPNTTLPEDKKAPAVSTSF